MNALELSQEVRRKYPDEAIGIAVLVACVDCSTERWSIQVYGNGWDSVPTAWGEGMTPEECLINIKDVNGEGKEA